MVKLAFVGYAFQIGLYFKSRVVFVNQLQINTGMEKIIVQLPNSPHLPQNLHV